jgi:hypothetical protein
MKSPLPLEHVEMASAALPLRPQEACRDAAAKPSTQPELPERLRRIELSRISLRGACPSGDSAEIPPKVEIRRKTLRSVEWQNSRSA